MARFSGRSSRWLCALVVGAIVAALGVWAQNAALVGVNYDDGIYALLAKALADGDGYNLTFLPVSLPGIKYPPVYPVSLVPFWEFSGSQAAALLGMKIANGLCIGLAAGLFTFLLVDLAILSPLLAVAVALLGFASGSMMLVSAGVLSEPLYLVLLFAALWVADTSKRDPRLSRLITAGLLAGLVVLTRTVGITLLVAVMIGFWQRFGWKVASKTVAIAALLIVPWIAFTFVRSGEVPELLMPRYGSYLQLYLANLDGSVWAAFDIAWANVGAILQTLGGKLLPQFGPLLRSLTGGLLIALAMLGSFRIWRDAPATAVYPWLYLGLVSVWSFPPFRFLFIVFPLLLALAVVSFPVLVPRATEMFGGSAIARGKRPSLRVALVGVGLIVLANLGYREVRALSRRVWDGAELDKSASSAELVDWVLENTDPETVIAYDLDALVALHTGRKVVPNNYEPVHIWYRREPSPPESLARLYRDMEVDYVAVRSSPLAAAPIDALMEHRPGSLSMTFVTRGGVLILETNLEALGANLGSPDRGSGPSESDERGQEN